MTKKRAKKKQHTKKRRSPARKGHPAKARRHRHHRKHKGLLGALDVSESKAKDAIMSTLYQAMSVAGGGLAGAIIGKHSLLVGIPFIVAGNYRKQALITSFGLGMAFSNGFQSAIKDDTGTNGLGSLDFKKLSTEAKARLKTYIGNFAEKLYIHEIPGITSKSVNGLGEADVKYFFNPYNEQVGAIDMSALDKLQEHVALLANSGQEQNASPLQGSMVLEEEPLAGSNNGEDNSLLGSYESPMEISEMNF